MIVDYLLDICSIEMIDHINVVIITPYCDTAYSLHPAFIVIILIK